MDDQITPQKLHVGDRVRGSYTLEPLTVTEVRLIAASPEARYPLPAYWRVRLNDGQGTQVEGAEEFFERV